MPIGEPGDLIYVPDHERQTLDWAPSQFRHRPVARGLIVAWGRAVQRAEDELFGLYADLPLDAAHGKTLEQWGDFVGAKRLGLDDEGYLALIKAKVHANRSAGDVDALLGVWAAVTAPSTVQYTPIYPACFRLTARRDTPLDPARARYAGRLMREIQPAGRAMVLLEISPGYLSFDGDPNEAGLDAGLLMRQL